VELKTSSRRREQWLVRNRGRHIDSLRVNEMRAVLRRLAAGLRRKNRVPNKGFPGKGPLASGRGTEIISLVERSTQLVGRTLAGLNLPLNCVYCWQE
jgi:hypothetical protein